MILTSFFSFFCHLCQGFYNAISFYFKNGGFQASSHLGLFHVCRFLEGLEPDPGWATSHPCSVHQLGRHGGLGAAASFSAPPPAGPEQWRKRQGPHLPVSPGLPTLHTAEYLMWDTGCLSSSLGQVFAPLAAPSVQWESQLYSKVVEVSTY